MTTYTVALCLLALLPGYPQTTDEQFCIGIVAPWMMIAESPCLVPIAILHVTVHTITLASPTSVLIGSRRTEPSRRQPSKRRDEPRLRVKSRLIRSLLPPSVQLESIQCPLSPLSTQDTLSPQSSMLGSSSLHSPQPDPSYPCTIKLQKQALDP
jgi:hypothetical protein